MELSRVNIYFAWLDVTNTHWMQPNLQAYANYLLNERDLGVNSVKSYLGTIRSRYNAWIDSPQTRKDLFDMTPEDWSMADKKAYVDEVLERVRLEISPRRVVLKTIHYLSRRLTDMKHFTLTALLVLVIVYLWRRLQDETTRTDANADKVHHDDALNPLNGR